jgi:MFS family permease
MKVRAAGLAGRLPFYYGWVVVVIAALAMVATLPGRTHGLGLIVEQLLSDLGIGRVEFGLLNLWATLVGAAFCLPVGRLIDQLGSRIVLATTLACLAAVVLVMAAVPAGWAGTFAMLVVLVTLTRGFGQSALSVVSLAVMGKWFSRRLGPAMGVYSVIVGLGFMASFAVVLWLTTDTSWQVIATGGATSAAALRLEGAGQLGWRTLWSGIGVCVLTLAPVSWLLVRDSGNDVGSVPETITTDAADFTLRQALATPAFWVFATATSLYGLISSGITLFNESILNERGFERTVYLKVMTYTAILGICSNFLGGWLAARWKIGRLMAVSMGLMAASLLVLPHVQTSIHVFLYATAMGLSGGVVTVVFFTVWGYAYGRAHLGRIQGVAQLTTVLASAFGPLLLGWSKEATGSYTLLFYILAPAAAVLGLCAWLVPVPSVVARQAALAPDRIPEVLETDHDRDPQRDGCEVSPIAERG